MTNDNIDKRAGTGTTDAEPSVQAPLSDLELARMIKELPGEMVPQRDLWAGIQRNILDHPQVEKNPAQQAWMPYAVAASLVIAISALMLNVVQGPGNALVQPQMVGVEQLQQEYIQVRNPMVVEFGRINDSLDQSTKTELYRNLDILAQARTELEQQVRADPDNRRLIEMLMKVHEQEIGLLKQDFTKPSRSL